MAACRSGGPPLARCDRPTSSLNLEEDSADSEVDWEAVSGWDSRSDSRAEEDSCGCSSASWRKASPRAYSRAAINLVRLADRLLSGFYHCAVRRLLFFAAGQLCQETSEKERHGRTAKDCPQIARRARHAKAFAKARKALPRRNEHPSFRWGYHVKYARRRGITLRDNAVATEESDSAAEAA